MPASCCWGQESKYFGLNTKEVRNMMDDFVWKYKCYIYNQKNRMRMKQVRVDCKIVECTSNP